MIKMSNRIKTVEEGAEEVAEFAEKYFSEKPTENEHQLLPKEKRLRCQ